MIIKNVALFWAKLGSNMDMGFDKNTPAWAVELRTTDKAEAKGWKEAGLNVKPGDDDGSVYYSASVKKPKFANNGNEQKAPPVVGKDLMPFAEVDAIGNGSRGNVKLYTAPYSYNGRTGISVRLNAIQITELVKYEGAGNALEGFEAFGGDDVTSEDDAF